MMFLVNGLFHLLINGVTLGLYKRQLLTSNERELNPPPPYANPNTAANVGMTMALPTPEIGPKKLGHNLRVQGG